MKHAKHTDNILSSNVKGRIKELKNSSCQQHIYENIEMQNIQGTKKDVNIKNNVNINFDTNISHEIKEENNTDETDLESLSNDQASNNQLTEFVENRTIVMENEDGNTATCNKEEDIFDLNKINEGNGK